MKFNVSRVAVAGAVVGLLGLGGAGYAYAQSSGSTPSTTTPGSAPSTNKRRSRLRELPEHGRQRRRHLVELLEPRLNTSAVRLWIRLIHCSR